MVGWEGGRRRKASGDVLTVRQQTIVCDCQCQLCSRRKKYSFAGDTPCCSNEALEGLIVKIPFWGIIHATSTVVSGHFAYGEHITAVDSNSTLHCIPILC